MRGLAPDPGSWILDPSLTWDWSRSWRGESRTDVVEKVSESSVKLPIRQLWEKSFPECALPDPVPLQDLAGGGAECEGLPLEGSVEGPVGVSPGVVTRQ